MGVCVTMSEQLDGLYHHWSETASSLGLRQEFEAIYQSYMRMCWSRRESILCAAADLNLPGRP